MTERPLPKPLHPFRWFPEFWQLSGRRLRPQARVLGLCLGVASWPAWAPRRPA
jgi:hypothetical protein